MRPWYPVSQGLRWLRAGTLLTLVSSALFILLSGSLLGYIISPVHYLISVGFFVALSGTARLAISGPATMGGKKLLGLALGAQLADYFLTNWGPGYYGQSFFSVGGFCHHLEGLLALVGFFGMLFGLRSLAVHVGRSDLGMAFVAMAGVVVATWALLWGVGHLNVSLVFEHLYALLFCVGGYVYVYSLLLKKLANAVDEFAPKA